ncbi:MAG TPA: biopolymer transporter ExbD [Gemmatales bacterium]|nr:biopolymer transporter ExbD [Gemmatales bacterium]
MSWRLRHEGSPSPIPQPLTTEQIVEGMKDGVYALTDEVKGPGDARWMRLENHPHFAEVAEVIQAMEEEGQHEADDNHIDMNPLIDVCLVLLVFFILATTMSVMEKVLSLPSNKQSNNVKPRQMTEEEMKKYIMVKVEKKGNETIYHVNDYAAKEDQLERELDRAVREGKTQMVLEVLPGVDFGSYTVVIDKARAARVDKIMTKAPAKAGSKAAPPAKGPPAS